MINNQLSSLIVSIMLEAIREEKGRLTAISDMCVINRQEFDKEGIEKLRLNRFVRLGAAMAAIMPRKRFQQMGQEIADTFWHTVERMENGAHFNQDEL